MMRKPKVVILGTGGTIAGRAGSNTEMTGYQAGEIGIQTLINAVPEMLEVADVTGEQFCNIGSFDMIDDIWLRSSRRVSELLQQPEVDGIVITHGTDTLEETAYFLNLTVKSEKPVVLVGAMRPATAMSADGPVNLLNAVALAGSQEAVGKGVLIAMNDQINGARDATKTNTTHVETFKSWELGYLGYFQNGKPIFYKASLRRHTAAAEFDISKVTALPRVDIVYLHVNCDDILVRAAVSAGALGIVIAAFGHGNLHINIKPALIKIARSGIPVVRSTRVGNGIVSRSADDTDNKPGLGRDQVMTYRNVPKATLQGVEFYGSHELGKNIFMNFGYTYLDAKDKTGGTRLTDRAKHQLTFGVSYHCLLYTSPSPRDS